MIGRSAASILLGHMLDDMNEDSGLSAVVLNAPAFSVRSQSIITAATLSH